jgi:hypothetical protein
MTIAQKICEDLTGIPCAEVEIDVPFIPKNWAPTVVGTPLAIIYLDHEGELAQHLFTSDELYQELQMVPNDQDLPDELVEELETTGSSLLADPRDEFVFITKTKLTNRGLENPEV